MQVSHHHDHVTHAVIGPMAAIAATIDDSAEFMHMVTSTIYSDQPLAVVREVICNAWDAHIQSGRTGTPILVTIDHNEMVIKDMGHGIPHSQIGQVYGTYGGSTKKKSLLETGGFGLGSKAPWAYQDSFEVTSCHQGEKTIYIMSKSSGEVMGKPSITPLMNMKTDESGLTVKIKMKPNDTGIFLHLIRRIISNGEMNALVNGVQAPTLPFSKLEKKYLFTREKLLSRDHAVNIRQGTVIYPLENHEDFRDEWHRAVKFVEELNGHQNHYGRGNVNPLKLVLQSAPGTVSPTPSRESLSMQAHTVKTAKTLLTDFNKLMQAKHFQTDKIEFVKAQVVRRVSDKPLLLLDRDMAMPYRSALRDASDNQRHIFTWKDVIALSTVNKTPPGQEYENIEFRLKKLIEAKVGDRGLLQSYLKVMHEQTHTKFKRPANQRRGPRDYQPYATWFRKRVLASLARDMQSKPGKYIKVSTPSLMNFSRLSLIDGRMTDNHNNYFAPVSRLRASTPDTLLPYLRKIVVLASSRTRASENMNKFPQWQELGDRNGALYYQTQPSARYQQAANEFFTQRGYIVLDLNQRQIWDPEPTDEPGPTVPKVKKVSVPRLKGFMALETITGNEHNRFRYKRVYVGDTSAGNPDAPRVLEPVCYLHVTREMANTEKQSLANISDPVATNLIKLWGKATAISYTGSQHEKLRHSVEKGGMELPELAEFAFGQVINRVTQTPNFLKYWSFAPENACHDSRFASFMQIPEVAELFGIDLALSEEDKLYRDLWFYYAVSEYRHPRTPYKSISFADAKKLIAKIPLDPAIKKAVHVYKTNPLLQVFDTENMVKIFNTATGSTFERHRAWLLKEMIKTALKG